MTKSWVYTNDVTVIQGQVVNTGGNLVMDFGTCSNCNRTIGAFCFFPSVPTLVTWQTATVLISLDCCEEGNKPKSKVLGFVDDKDPVSGVEVLLTGC